MVLKGKIKYVNQSISEKAQDLIQKLVCVNVEQRIDLQEALKHPWFEGVHLSNIRQRIF